MAGGEEGRQRKREWLKPSKWLELYSRWVYKRPLTILALIAAVLVLCTVGTLASNAMEIADEGDEWTLKENEHAQRDEAITQAEDQLGEFITQSKRSDDHEELKLSFIYKAKEGGMNMFTEENLEVVREVENTMLRNPKYKEFCELNYTTPDSPKCVTQQTPLRFFFEFDEENPELGFGNPIRTPEEALAIMSQDFFTNGFFFTKEFPETGNTSSLYTQSRYSFGLPIANYTNSNEEDEDQVEYVYNNFLEELEEDLWDILGMEAPNFFRTEYSETGELRGVEVVFGAFAMLNEEFTRAVWKDFTWAFLSLIAVWLYMMFHLGSVFLSVVGAFEVFMAFPTGLFIYRTLFQVDYFAELHILIIFILLGLGADDVFVFTDAFKQSENMPGVGKSLPARLQYTAHRASKAVFVTSFTTAAAFFATATSELMPMKAFGIFAGICIVVLFLINVLMMPAALVLWAGYTPWCVRRCCCCCVPLCNISCVRAALPCCTCCHINEDPGFAEDPESLVAPVVALQAPNGKGDGESTQSGEGSDSAYSAPKKQAVDGQGEKAAAPPAGVEAVENMRPLERFFNGNYFKFLKRSRFAIILIGFALFGTGLYYVTTLEPPKEAEEWWPSWHNFHKFTDLTDRGGPFLSEDEDSFSTVHLAWGLKGFDQSGRDIWDPEDFGTLEYDQDFDMTAPEAQRHLLGVCARAREAPCKANACDADEDGNKFLVRFDRSKPDSFERCWIEDFHIFVQNSTELGYPEGLPVNATDFIPILKDFMATETFLLTYQGQVGLVSTEEGDDLRFVQFELLSTYRPPTSHKQTEPVLNDWEDFMKEENAQAAANGAAGVSRGFQTGRYAWVWLWSQKALIDNAVTGIFIVFAIAFVVLNLATGNVVISVLAIMTVAGVVTSVMGLGVGGIMGWEFGIAESIVSIILVGFSMDYSLHLADSYIESERFGRFDRTQDSLTRLGISVTAGAITTLISGLFLWGAILTFFTKFAFMITSTIISSYLWSMLFFPAMAMTFGPEGEFGNWSAIFAAVRDRCSAARRGQGRQDQTLEMA